MAIFYLRDGHFLDNPLALPRDGCPVALRGGPAPVLQGRRDDRSFIVRPRLLEAIVRSDPVRVLAEGVRKQQIRACGNQIHLQPPYHLAPRVVTPPMLLHLTLLDLVRMRCPRRP